MDQGDSGKHAKQSDYDSPFMSGQEHAHGRISSNTDCYTALPRDSEAERLVETIPHTPVPATTVFAYDAAPLDLPDLNAFLSRLPAPSFKSFPTGVRTRNEVLGVGMFPPMDHLAATKKSLQDLENNNTIVPAWRNRTSIMSGIVNVVLGITDSSAISTFYSLHGIIDTVQIFALIISTIIPRSNLNVRDSWRGLLIGTIPNVLALNLGSTLGSSCLILGILLGFTALLLYYFWSTTNKCDPLDAQEGFTSEFSRESGWGIVFVCFVLSILYLPLSTIVTHALVWSDDFWVVSNPYINVTSYPPIVPSLGPSDQFHDPLDFCYTTTMKRNEVNYAPLIVIISASAFMLITVWFPLRLHRIIKQAVPKVDRYTELGTRRSSSDMDREYQRLLERDRLPLAFLYSDFRRGWGTYRSFYLFAKLSALIMIAIINPDNCLFRSIRSRTDVLVSRQALLVVAMLAFFLIQCRRAPFIDPVDNASEWTSRLSYLLTSLVGLRVVVGLPGQDILNGPILYIIYVLTYGLSIYFTCINFSWMHRIVKRISGRIDFSIDVFSPKLDLTPLSPHVKRRIWQETITTLFLTTPDCKIPVNQPMLYSQARDSEYPPYLMNFKGFPAERHTENLKILRELGLKAYTSGLSISDDDRSRRLQDWIQISFVGPDCYWKDADSREEDISHFGTAWWIPFPPSLVMRFDDGHRAVLNKTRQFKEYLAQNRSKKVNRKRQIRLALRALDGQIVYWPYEHRKPVGKHTRFCCSGRRYQAQSVIKFQTCIFSIRHRGQLLHQNFNLGSGFEIELAYAKDVRVSKDIIGLNDDWDLSPILARFLAQNQALISERLSLIEQVMQNFRKHHWRECIWKADVLSYHFLTTVYDMPQKLDTLLRYLTEQENDLRVRQLAITCEAAFISGYERFEMVTSSSVTTWWYILWDDLWRRNYDTIRGLSLHKQDFDPHYPTSIAYRPLPRPALELFLSQRGLFKSKATPNSFFHCGFLNKIYFRLNEIAFHDSSHAIIFHVGGGSSEFALSAIDAAAHARSSSLGTGGGTDHDDASIRARPNYRWEGILEDPFMSNKMKRFISLWIAKLAVWFGMTPLWQSGTASSGLALDVKFDNGKYVLI
ncbi:hypothetical protein DFH11DRAFT_1558766 [Phellopilus nigrolimitatus]|nr:hypothetical protein DFH11DRAFT_1558766 [Phellopilus nigrolimitatus]